MKSHGIIIFVFLSLTSTWSQPTVADSLIRVYEQTTPTQEKVKLLNEITYAHCFFDPKTGVEYGNQAIQLSNELKETPLKARAYLNTAIAYHLMDEWEMVEQLANVSLSKAIALHNKSIQARSLNMLGIAAVGRGKLDEGLVYYQNGLEIGLLSSDSMWAKTTFNTNIGAIYGRKGSYKKALEYFEKDLLIGENLGQYQSLITPLSNMANIASLAGLHDKELAYLKRAEQLAIEYKKNDGLSLALAGLTNYYYNKVDSVEIALEHGNRFLELARQMNSPMDESLALINLVEIYKIKGDLTKAELLLSQAEDLIANNNEPDRQLHFLRCASNLRYAQQRYTASLDYANELLKIATKEERLDEIMYAQQERYKALEALHENKAALEAYKAFHLAEDSLESNAFGEKIIALEAALTNLENEKTIAVLAQEKITLENRIQRNRFLALSLILLLALAILATLFYITRQRQNHLLLEQENELILAREAIQTQELIQKEVALEKSNDLLEVRAVMLRELELKLENNSERGMTLEELKAMKVLTPDDEAKLHELFNEIFPSFLARLKQELPKLSSGQLRLIMLIKLGFDNAEIATTLGISTNSVHMSRYRLRKKLSVGEPTDFQTFIQKI